MDAKVSTKCRWIELIRRKGQVRGWKLETIWKMLLPPWLLGCMVSWMLDTRRRSRYGKARLAKELRGEQHYFGVRLLTSRKDGTSTPDRFIPSRTYSC